MMVPLFRQTIPPVRRGSPHGGIPVYFGILFRGGLRHFGRIIRLRRIHIRFLQYIRLRIPDQKRLCECLFRRWQLWRESISALASAQLYETEIRIPDRLGVEIADLGTDRIGA